MIDKLSGLEGAGCLEDLDALRGMDGPRGLGGA